MGENRDVGGVTWHSSDEDGLPDVGVSVYLGPDDRLYCGEISRDLFERCGGAEHFDNDLGWFLVRFAPGNQTRLIARVGDRDAADDLIETVAFWAREATLPTMAKTLGDMARSDA